MSEIKGVKVAGGVYSLNDEIVRAALENLRKQLGDGSFIVGLANAVKAGAITLEMLDENLKLSASVVDDLETDDAFKPLSANQGKILKELIDIINGTGEGSTDKKITDAIAKLVDNAPENLDTLKELAEWIENHGTEAADMLVAINANAAAIANEAQRAQNAEQALGIALQEGLSTEATARNSLAEDIRANAMQYDTLGVFVRADKAEIYGRSIDTTPRVVEFPAATTESAGVMSAEDKAILDNQVIKQGVALPTANGTPQNGFNQFGVRTIKAIPAQKGDKVVVEVKGVIPEGLELRYSFDGVNSLKATDATGGASGPRTEGINYSHAKGAYNYYVITKEETVGVLFAAVLYNPALVPSDENAYITLQDKNVELYATVVPKEFLTDVDLNYIGGDVTLIQSLKNKNKDDIVTIDPVSTTIDFGADPVLIIKGTSYILKNVCANWRTLNYKANIVSSAIKIIFNTETKLLRGEIYDKALSSGDVVIGSIRHWAADRVIASFPFDYKIKGESVIEDAVAEAIEDALVGDNIEVSKRNGSQGNSGNSYTITIYGSDNNSAIPVQAGRKYRVYTDRPNTGDAKYYINFATYSTSTPTQLYTDYVRGPKAFNVQTVSKDLPSIDDIIVIDEGEFGLSVSMLEFSDTKKDATQTPLRIADFNDYKLYLIDVTDSIYCRIDTLEEDVNKIKGTDVNVPYERNIHKSIELTQACRLNKDATGSKDYQLLICTDSHSQPLVESNAVSVTNGFKTIDSMIHCGDILGSYFVKSQAEGFSARMSKCDKPYYVVLGNHDVGNGNYVGKCCTQEQAYQYFIKPIVDKGWLKQGEYTDGKCYYYHDFTDRNIRLIVLNEYENPLEFDETYWKAIPYDSNYATMKFGQAYTAGDKVNVNNVNGLTYTDYSFEAVSNVTTQSIVGYGAKQNNWPGYKTCCGYRLLSHEQAQWFLNTLAETPANYTVIVALHNPFSDVAEVVEAKFSQTDRVGVKGSVYSQNYMITDFIANAVNAFQQGTNYVEQIVMKGDAAYLNTLNDGSSDYAYSVTKDFSIKNSGAKFGCFVGGHVHMDLVWKHQQYNQYQITPICATFDSANSRNNDIARPYTDNIAVDCLTVLTQRSASIALVKIGCDKTMDGDIRNFEVIKID